MKAKRHIRLVGQESGSRENLLRYFAGYIRQAEVATGVAVGELLVIKSHEGEQCRVEVVVVHPAFHGVRSVFVRGTEGKSFFTPAPASHMG